MSKKLLQANNIVAKATGVFGEAAVQVEKANELLVKSIEEDSFSMISIKNKIFELQRKMDDLKESKIEKGKQIESNDNLIEQLRSFVPVQ